MSGSESAPERAFGVLLVENDPMQRMSTAEALRAAGLAVVEAAGIDAAIAALAGRADLRAMIADVDLVGETMTGFLLAKVVAARWPEVAILVVPGMTVPTADHLPAGALPAQALRCARTRGRRARARGTARKGLGFDAVPDERP